MENKTGLVLEGGATRGMYTAGVLDVFMENNIDINKIVGVSAGALFGVNYVSKQIGRAIRYNKKFNKDKNYMGLIPLIKEGNIICTKYAYEDVPLRLDPFDTDTYNSSDKEFYAVVTNVDTGNAEYIKVEKLCDQMDILRASGSMPLVSKPVKTDGKRYLDGAVKDSIPYEWMAKQGANKIIVVLTQDISYRKKPMNKTLMKLYGLKYPKIAEGMMERHNMYNKQLDDLEKWEKEGKAFVIRPSVPIVMGRLERKPEILEKVYELGRNDAFQKLKELKEYLNITD